MPRPVLHSKNIPDMLLKRIYALEGQITKLELELSCIKLECPERTSCYLRFLPRVWKDYGYAPGGPHRSIEDWQDVLARWYGEEATRIIRERDDLLKRKYRLNSRYLKLTGDAFVPYFTAHALKLREAMKEKKE